MISVKSRRVNAKKYFNTCPTINFNETWVFQGCNTYRYLLKLQVGQKLSLYSIHWTYIYSFWQNRNIHKTKKSKTQSYKFAIHLCFKTEYSLFEILEYLWYILSPDHSTQSFSSIFKLPHSQRILSSFYSTMKRIKKKINSNI